MHYNYDIHLKFYILQENARWKGGEVRAPMTRMITA